MTAKALQIAAVGAVGGLECVAARGYKAMGVPYYWKDVEGLDKAVKAFFMRSYPDGAKAKYLADVSDYLVYWIYAPCWRLAARGNDRMTEGLEELKRRVLTLASEESVQRFIDEAMELVGSVLGEG